MNEKGAKILPLEIEEKLSLENTYKILNSQLDLLLSDKEKSFVREIQGFCIGLEPKIDFSKDVYELFPEYGKRGFMQRLNPWKEFTEAGCKYEMLLAINNGMMDPEMELARTASSILCGNPTYQHGTTPEIQKVQDDLWSGQKFGCIAMTEENHGTDTVNMECHADAVDDGYKFTGTKIFTTNGPKAHYFLGYACVDNKDPRGTMVQAILKRDWGITTEKLDISVVNRVHIGKTYYNGAKVPKEYVLGTPGEGYHNLFDGLVPERLVITGANLGICWGALINGIIYSNMRKQFGKPIMKYQAVSYPFADLLYRVSSATMAAFKIAEIYDEKVLHAEKVSKEMHKASAQWSAQIKFLCAKLAAECAYETQQLMGGISVTDNTRLARLTGASNIQEVIGGSRGVMKLIMSGNLKKILNLL